MQTYPGDPDVRIESWDTHKTSGCQVDRLHLGSHSGTHIDAPRHFSRHGSCIDELPLERFIGCGTIVKLQHKMAGERIEKKDIEPILPLINPGEFLVFQTGWDKYFGKEAYLHHPYFSEGLTSAILELGVSLVGIDALSIDPTTKGSFKAHSILMPQEVLIVENLCNLDQVKETRGWFSFLPLKIHGGDGSPIRAVYLGNQCPFKKSAGNE